MMFLAAFSAKKSPKQQKKLPKMIKKIFTKFWLKDGLLLSDLSKAAFKLMLTI